MISHDEEKPGGHAPGDKVRVCGGTFVGQEGVILSVPEVLQYEPNTKISKECRAGKTCWVLLSVFGRQIPVEFMPWQVVPEP